MSLSNCLLKKKNKNEPIKLFSLKKKEEKSLQQQQQQQQQLQYYLPLTNIVHIFPLSRKDT